MVALIYEEMIVPTQPCGLGYTGLYNADLNDLVPFYIDSHNEMVHTYNGPRIGSMDIFHDELIVYINELIVYINELIVYINADLALTL